MKDILQICQWYPELYERRAKCYEALGQIQKAIADIRAVTKLIADSTEAYYKISQLYYQIGDVEESLKFVHFSHLFVHSRVIDLINFLFFSQVRECLKLNPDHKKCFPHYKNVKKLAKMFETLHGYVRDEQWMQCLEKAQQILKAESSVPAIQMDVLRLTCKCNWKVSRPTETME